MQAMRAPAYLGELEHLLLLAILRCDGNAYTVPIRAMLAEHGGRRLTRGALYTSLDRLEGKGLVRSRLGDPLAARGGRARRYFEVTPAGFRAIRAARAALATLSHGLDGLLESKT
jgi:DNA-binding PadR family transcriptional regulator